MNIYLAVAALTYIMILILAYGVIIFTKLEETKSEKIINKAFSNAYSILAFGLLIVYALFLLPHITVSNQTISYLLLISKYFSVFTLGGSLFFLAKKYGSP